MLRIDPRKRLVIVSLAATIFILLVRLLVYFFTKSLTVLADAFHSVSDLLGNIIALTAITISLRGPDEEHLYGHEKAESIGSLMISFLLIGVFIYVIYESIQRVFFTKEVPEFTIWSSLMILMTIMIDAWRFRALERGAVVYGSSILQADSLHYRSDFYISLTVLALSIIGSLSISREFIGALDIVFSIAIASYLVRASYRLARTSIDELMDRAPREVVVLFREIAEKHDLVVRSVRARRSASKIFIDAIVEMPPSISLEEAHSVIDDVERELREKIKRSIDIIVHMEPRDIKREELKKELINWLRSLGEVRGVHDVEIVADPSGYHVRFHIEARPELSIEEVNRLNEFIKNEVKKRFPEIRSVAIHIEPVCLSEISVREAIDSFFRKDPDAKKLLRILSIRVIETPEKTLIDVSIEIKQKTTISEAHEVISRLEGYLREVLGDKAIVTIETRSLQKNPGINILDE